MNTAEIAAVIASVLLATLIIFQLLLAAGLPLGAYAWGGQYEGVLPTRMVQKLISRGTSALSPLFSNDPLVAYDHHEMSGGIR